MLSRIVTEYEINATAAADHYWKTTPVYAVWFRPSVPFQLVRKDQFDITAPASEKLAGIEEKPAAENEKLVEV